jgi:hypothetical protein
MQKCQSSNVMIIPPGLTIAAANDAKPLLLATNAPPEGNAASLVLPLAVAFDNDLTASGETSSVNGLTRSKSFDDIRTMSSLTSSEDEVSGSAPHEMRPLSNSLFAPLNAYFDRVQSC